MPKILKEKTMQAHAKTSPKDEKSQSKLIKLCGYEIPNEKIIINGKPYTVKEYEDKFKIPYRHGLYYRKGDAELIDEMKRQCRSKTCSDKAVVEAFMKHPKSYLGVRDTKTIFGYGSYAVQPIPGNTVYGIYSGLLVFSKPGEKETTEKTTYDMSLVSITFNEIEYSVCIRASDISDVTRFSLHAPSEKVSKTTNTLLSNSSYPMTIIEDGIPIHYLCSLKDGILAGCFNLISYGDAYLSSSYEDKKKRKGYWINRGDPIGYPFHLAQKQGSKDLIIKKFDKASNSYKPTAMTIPALEKKENPKQSKVRSASKALGSEESKQKRAKVDTEKASLPAERQKVSFAFARFHKPKQKINLGSKDTVRLNRSNRFG